MGKLLIFDPRRNKGRMKAALLTSKQKVIPIATFAKGKFTLGIYYEGPVLKAIIYNTTTKIQIAKRTPHPCETRQGWMLWAETMIAKWENRDKTPVA